MSERSLSTLRMLGTPFNSAEEKIKESVELYGYVLRNKIELLYLESLKRQQGLSMLRNAYEKDHLSYTRFMDGLTKLITILDSENIDYVIVKTLKPYPAIPGDVDLLILGDDEMYLRTAEILLGRGYVSQIPDLIDMKSLDVDEKYRTAARILTKPTYGGRKYGLKHVSPTGTDLADPEYYVDIDLQKEIALSYIVYLDKSNFKKHVTTTELRDGVEVKTLKPEADLVVLIAHSLIEQLYILGEFYTLLYYLKKMSENQISDFIDMLNKNKLLVAGKVFATITAELCKEAYGALPEKIERLVSELGYDKFEAERLVKNAFKAPHRYNLSTLRRVFFEKFGENRFRKGFFVQTVRMLDPRLTWLVAKSLIEMRRREYYLKRLDLDRSIELCHR